MTNTPIADQVAMLESQMRQQVPADVLSQFVAEREQLNADGAPHAVAAVGSPMPDGDLLDAHGGSTTLRAALDGKPGVVVFYRGAWCPYCNLTLRTYQSQLLGELDGRGAVLVAISPQAPDGSLSMQETNELAFTVLSDPGNQIAGELGVLTEPTPDVKAAQSALGLDLTAVNADGTAVIPMPTTVVVDAQGDIRWIDVHPDYATRSEPEDILAAYDEAIG